MHQVKPLAKRSQIVTQEISDEILIYDLRSNQAFSLNSTSALVWQYCDGHTSIKEIAGKMTDYLHKSVSEDLVWLSLDELKKQNLIENQPELSTYLSQVSRRELVRKAGLATLVALPFVTSLVAPVAANAQSGCGAVPKPNGCTCSANTECANGCCGSDGTSNACVSPGSDGINNYCRTSCECSSGCCVGNSCASNSVAVGSFCSTGCQCASQCCVGNSCAANTVASGSPCSLGCQCISRSCAGGTCT